MLGYKAESVPQVPNLEVDGKSVTGETIRYGVGSGYALGSAVVVVCAGVVYPLVPRSGRGLRRRLRVRRLQRWQGVEGLEGDQVSRHRDRVGPELLYRQWCRGGFTVEQVRGRVR